MNIKVLIENIVKSIVDDESNLKIDIETSPYQTDLTIKVRSSDVGKLVGRKGKTISAIRNLLDLIATQAGVLTQYNVWIEENKMITPVQELS